MINQIAAHELGLPLSDQYAVPLATDLAPVAVGSLASRVTISTGNAAIMAAQRWRVGPRALAVGAVFAGLVVTLFRNPAPPVAPPPHRGGTSASRCAG